MSTLVPYSLRHIQRLLPDNYKHIEKRRERLHPSHCIVPGCTCFNDDVGATNLCGHHLEELLKKIKILKRMKDPRFYHNSYKRIENLSKEQILALLGARVDKP
jgi:hypothetical protein